jgi:hypothetical protein
MIVQQHVADCKIIINLIQKFVTECTAMCDWIYINMSLTVQQYMTECTAICDWLYSNCVCRATWYADSVSVTLSVQLLPSNVVWWGLCREVEFPVKWYVTEVAVTVLRLLMMVVWSPKHIVWLCSKYISLCCCVWL